MKTILCNDCGQIMTRYKTRCTACSRTDLLFFPTHDDEGLRKRLKEIRRAKGNNGLHRLMLTSMGLAVLFVVGYSAEHDRAAKQNQNLAIGAQAQTQQGGENVVATATKAPLTR